jgi:hypothetical protein
MEKKKYYYKTKFPFPAIEDAHDRFRQLAGCAQTLMKFWLLITRRGNEQWGHDTRVEFAGTYGNCDSYTFDEILPKEQGRFNLSGDDRSLSLAVQLPARSMIEDVFATLERHLDEAKIVTSEEVQIFIGHGRDPQWRQLQEHLRDHHGFKVTAYEVGPRAGMSVKEVLEEMLASSAFALLVLTGEDLHADGELHARDNVIHELGLFQGRLGFLRAIALLEDDVREFSNILGVNQIRFPTGMIRATFGDVLVTIRREFAQQ